MNEEIIAVKWPKKINHFSVMLHGSQVSTCLLSSNSQLCDALFHILVMEGVSLARLWMPLNIATVKLEEIGCNQAKHRSAVEISAFKCMPLSQNKGRNLNQEMTDSDGEAVLILFSLWHLQENHIAVWFTEQCSTETSLRFFVFSVCSYWTWMLKDVDIYSLLSRIKMLNKNYFNLLWQASCSINLF